MDGTMNKKELKDKCYEEAKFLIDNGYVDEDPETLAKKIYYKKRESRRTPQKTTV